MLFQKEVIQAGMKNDKIGLGEVVRREIHQAANIGEIIDADEVTYEGEESRGRS